MIPPVDREPVEPDEAPVDVRGAITSLRLVFWGGILCIFDIKISETRNGSGWTFDFLNDFLGMLLITAGVFQLARLEREERYWRVMTFVRVVAVLSCLSALDEHFIYKTPAAVSFLHSVLGVAAMLATVCFSMAMRWLSLEAGLERSARSWNTTTVLFVAIYLIPLGSFYCLCALAMATGTSFNLQLGPAGLLLLPVFATPVFHLFVSTSSMKREAAALARSRHAMDCRDARAEYLAPRPPHHSG